MKRLLRISSLTVIFLFGILATVHAQDKILSGAANENDDNTIYIVGRKFQFSVYYFDDKDSIKKIDSLNLEVTDDFYPQASQTSINWIHYQVNKNDTTVEKESTGVKDSQDRFFIHPPRQGDLYILSFAVFPALRTYLFSDSTLPYNSSGVITMMKSYEGQPINSVETFKEYKGKKFTDTPFKNDFLTYHLTATAKSEIGTILGNYYFSEIYGFVRLDYKLPDNSSISIRLSGVDFDN